MTETRSIREAAAVELETAYGECATLSLLHGAARIRNLPSPPEDKTAEDPS